MLQIRKEKDMIKYCVYDECSEISSEIFDTYEEAKQELDENLGSVYSFDAVIYEVND